MASDPFPMVKVLVSWNANTVAPVWTDISQWYDQSYPASTEFGRTYETDTVDPGTASLTLDNTDGRFTAESTSSPYWPYVKPARRIKIQMAPPAGVVGGGVFSDVFTGEIEAIAYTWPGGVNAYSTAAVSAVDASARLKRSTLPSAFRSTVLADSPKAFYSLSGTGGLTDLTGNNGATLVPAANVSLGGSSLVAGDNGASANFPSSNLNSTSPANIAVPLDGAGYLPIKYAGGLAAEMVFQLTDDPIYPSIPAGGYTNSYALNLFDMRAGGVGSSLGCGIGYITRSDGSKSTQMMVYSNGQVYNFAFPFLFDKRSHHAVLTVDSTASIVQFIVDGNIGIYWNLTTALSDSHGGFLTIGGIAAPNYTSYQQTPGVVPPTGFVGNISHVALYDTPLTSGQIINHFSKMANISAGDTPITRISSVLSYVGWNGTTDLDAGISPLGPALDDGVDALTALQAVANADGGVFYVNPSGVAVYRSFHNTLNQATAHVFDCSRADLDVNLQFDLDTTRLVNVVNGSLASDTNNTTVVVADAASRSDVGDWPVTLTPSLQNQSDLLDRMTWRLGRDSVPRTRGGTITFDPLTEPTHWPYALAATINDQVQVINLPAQAPQSTMSFTVEKVTRNWQRSSGSSSFTVTLQLSPVMQAAGQPAGIPGVAANFGGTTAFDGTAFIAY